MTQPDFSAKGHTYSHGGQRLHSVTRILDHGGLRGGDFFGDQGTEYLDRGTLIHDLTARHDAGQRVDQRRIPVRWRGHYRAWPRFRRETGFVPSLIEHRVMSVEAGFAGTLDRLGDFEKRTPRGLEGLTDLQTLLDIKNAKTGGCADWVRYQLVGYGHALNPRKLYNRVGVVLMADGTYKVKVFSVADWHRDLEVFLRAAESLRRGTKFMDFAAVQPRRKA